jgi:hypothetical protein
MAKLHVLVAVLLAACVGLVAANSDSSSAQEWAESSSWEGNVLHPFYDAVPATKITTLDTLPPIGFGSSTYSSCTYDPNADLATFTLYEVSSPSDDGDYSLTEQTRYMRGGCQSSNVIFLYDAYYQLNLHERRAQPNSLAASLLLFRATGMAFNADGAAILSTFCVATGRLYQPVLLTECLAATCASRTSWIILSWVNANSFALSPVSCSIGNIPTNINYAQPFQKAVLTSEVAPIPVTDSSATAVFPCIMLLVAAIMALL